MRLENNISRKIRRKRWLAFTILLAGIFTSIFIVGAAGNDTSRAQKSELAQALSKKLETPQVISSTTIVSPSKTAGGNLSEKVSTVIVQDIIAKNKDSLSGSGRKTFSVPPDSRVIDKALEEGLNASLDFPIFDKSDVKISNDDSTEAQVNYLTQLVSVFNKYFASINVPLEKTVGDFLLDGDSTLIKKYLDTTPKYITEVLVLPAPSSLVEIHVKNLNLWQKRLAVLSAISKLSDDPLKTLVAMRYLDEIERENATLETALEERFKKFLP